jgi:arsenite methyltransferase
MPNQEVAELIRHSSESEYAVIDVRRIDHAVSRSLFFCFATILLICSYRKGGHVRGSHQWPAQTFYDDLDIFYEKFGDVQKVIFYCSRSNGRGPRCAGW